MTHPLFTSGTARGGTNLRAQLLSANRDVRVASDPFIPLFREFRNAVLRHVGDAEVLASLDPDSPLDEYYFSPIKLRVMQSVQHADLALPFDRARWPELRKALLKRTALASSDLLPYLDELPGPTWRDVFGNALAVIRRARRGEDAAWVGFNDNWAVEFFAPLAHAFPDAKFMIHFRDPRGAIEGALYTHPEPHMIPLVLSFARHWRKYVAFALEYLRQPRFSGRLHVSTFEAVVLNPEAQARKMADFLGIDYDPVMLNINAYHLATGEPWPATWEIYRNAVDLWARKLPAAVVEAIEFVCDREMRLLGYQPVLYTDARGLSGDALEWLDRDCRECVGWRTDFRLLEIDVGCELFRRRVLSTERFRRRRETLERCFLFPHVYDTLRDGTRVDALADTVAGVGQ